jgi:hypothetical protein
MALTSSTQYVRETPTGVRWHGIAFVEWHFIFNQQNGWVSAKKGRGRMHTETVWSLNFWCLNPAVVSLIFSVVMYLLYSENLTGFQVDGRGSSVCDSHQWDAVTHDFLSVWAWCHIPHSTGGKSCDFCLPGEQRHPWLYILHHKPCVSGLGWNNCLRPKGWKSSGVIPKFWNIAISRWSWRTHIACVSGRFTNFTFGFFPFNHIADCSWWCLVFSAIVQITPEADGPMESKVSTLLN